MPCLAEHRENRLIEGTMKSTTEREYIAMLRRMSPEARLRKAFELADLGRELFRHGLRRRFPNLSQEQLEELARTRLEKCHNRIY
jgi:hypothetical protein